MKKVLACFALAILILATGLVPCTLAAEPEKVLIVKEAEDFTSVKGDWEAKPWGTNYYAAGFANSFLSRQAYLGAPEQGVAAEAVTEVDVPVADTYLVLARYEAAYRFETQFGIKIEQNGEVVFDTLYGARENPKVWFFYTRRQKKLIKEFRFSWGPVENVVWEGTEYKVDPQPGKARITLYKGEQPGIGARRNVDLVMLTNDEEDVKHRLENENYLPLDGLLTQKGDLYVKIKNEADSPSPIILHMPFSVQHSPYWIHIRDPFSKTIGVRGEFGKEQRNPQEEDWLLPGQESPWVEIGVLADTLNDCGWYPLIRTKRQGQNSVDPKGKAHYTMSLAVPGENGELEVLRTFEDTKKNPFFTITGNVIKDREIFTRDEVLAKLNDEILKFPKHGRIPDKILFYPTRSSLENYIGYVADTLGINTDDCKNSRGETVPELHTDVRHIKGHDKLQEWCDKQKEEGKADLYRIISLGDEIGMHRAGGDDLDKLFRKALAEYDVEPSDIVPGAKSYDEIKFNRDDKNNARLTYYSRMFDHYEGRRFLKERTNILRKNLPNALIGANYSPHPFFMPHTNQWVNVFKDEAMTMPWSEGYLWQIPTTSQQVLGFLVDAFRCATKYHDQLIYMYIMPHTPGNTASAFRRAFYMDVAHGAKYFDFFTPVPTALAYTENHLREEDLDMWKAMYDVIRDAGTFEDIVFDGKVRPAKVAMLLSESSELWGHSLVFNAEKQHIWMALKHAQLPVDFLIEDDVADGYLDDYKVLYISDPCVSEDASQKIVKWVKKGGQLFASAGAATRNEFNEPNEELLDLFGIEPAEMKIELDVAPFFGKENLPWAEPLDAVRLGKSAGEIPVFIGQQKFKTAGRVKWRDSLLKFKDGSPAVITRKVRRGKATYAGFFPGMAYFQPAIPKRPCDRGATDDAFTHFIPTEFDQKARDLILSPVAHIDRPVECSVQLVEPSLIESDTGIAVPLINWSGAPVEQLEVTIKNPGKVSRVGLASEGEVDWKKDGKDIIVTLPLEVADMILLYK